MCSRVLQTLIFDSPVITHVRQRAVGLLLAFVCLLVCSQHALAVPADDLLASLHDSGYVNDFAGVLSPGEKAALEEKCAGLAARTGSELSVVTLKSLAGGDVDDFAEKLFKKWEIGQGGKDNGVLLLVSIDDRKARIEVGYGLEGVLPDILAGQILRENLFPAFRQQRYAAGLDAAVTRMAEIITRNEPAAAPGGGGVQQPAPMPTGMALMVLSFLALISCPASYTAGNLLRFGEVAPAAERLPLLGMATFAPIFFGLSPQISLLMAGVLAVAGILGFLSNDATSGRGTASRRRFDPWSGSFGGGRPSSWGGGGFSGGGGGSWGGFGGGRSGGGGASGGW
ncbi:TPM domain-containing protein [Planctomicrobium sp. SH664]|uniref:TPM domain-containing protein n=1 Tax=Planctomicrobium sp. SH664 TaxID=3448125 RepID=UPI003F5B0999